jgi:4-hydroxyphenylpyruvate dioxygenase
VAVVEKLRGRGVEFLPIPHSYYDLLKSRLSEREKDTNCKQPQPIEEDLSKVSGNIVIVELRKDYGISFPSQIRELGILMDFDERGYLLQIFTKPVQDVGARAFGQQSGKWIFSEGHTFP